MRLEGWLRTICNMKSVICDDDKVANLNFNSRHFNKAESMTFRQLCNEILRMSALRSEAVNIA